MSKIVLVTNIPAPYRVDLFYYMQTHIKEHDFFIVYTNKNEDDRLWSEDKGKYINTEFLKSRIIKIKGKLYTKYIHIPGNMYKVLNRISPDAIIAWEYNPSAIKSLMWCKVRKKKYIHLTDGTLFSERNISFFQKITRKIITTNADTCIASSTKAKEKLIHWGVDESNIFISYLTVDIRKYVSIQYMPKNNRLLYVGRVMVGKGLDLLFDALEILDISWELHIVGDGPEDEMLRLKKIASEKNIEKNIVWCGFKEGESLQVEYQEAKVFVLPTREDCFGLVMLEAVCSKTKVVASKYADGAYDVIENGKNGTIVDPYNAKELADSIKHWLLDSKDEDMVPDFVIERFSFENVSKGYLNAIEKAFSK